MDVKKIRFLKELKVRARTWRQGSILEAPFPPPIVEEIKAQNSGKVFPFTIEILETGSDNVPVPKVPEVPVVQSEPEPVSEQVPETMPEPTPPQKKSKKPVVRRPSTKK